MSRSSLRVYLVTHHDGKQTGRLLARGWSQDVPVAYGATREEVLAGLEQVLADQLAGNPAALEPFLWDEQLNVRSVALDVHPQTVVKKRWVIGKDPIPLRLTFAWSKLDAGGFRVVLPRFDWWFVLEDLAIAPQVLRQAVSNTLLGAQGRSLFDFRSEGPETIESWAPPLLGRARSDSRPPSWEAFPTLHAVAEELVMLAAGRRRRQLIEPPDLRPHGHLWERETPASILLVGGPGVGKTTWVDALARQFTRMRRGKGMAPSGGGQTSPRIWSTSADRIIAGMQYLGQWEQRCLDMIHELSNEGDYLYVGQLPPLLDVRTARNSIADFFLPAIEAEEVSLIAECHPHEYEQLKTKAPRLLACFHTINIAETPAVAMAGLLRAYQARINPSLALRPEALRRVIQQLELFRRDTCFPGKGFRFIDWLNQEQGHDETLALARKQSRSKLDPTSPSSPTGDDVELEFPEALEIGPEASRQLGAAQASAAFSRYTGLPLELISEDSIAGPELIAERLRAGVVGQDRACSTAARVLARFKAGLDDPERPVGSLFFVGPTGVGKTELAKQLARYMFGASERMIRLDMSEYMLHGSAQRLLAVGPGVQSLAEQVRQQPLSLILLDEIEKAHAEVFDLLLAVLGEGRMTDDAGSLIDFRMTVIVMTSNLGVSERGAAGFGGQDEDTAARSFDAAVRRHFRPEFFNRIDFVVPFRNLAPDDIRRIVDLELAQMQRRTGLSRRGLSLAVSAAARATLADWGWHPTRGARPLKRVLEEQVMAPLAVLLARQPGLRERAVKIVDAAEAGDDDPLTLVLASERPSLAR